MNIIRLYNQNRRKIFNIIFVIAAIVFAIQLANYLVSRKTYKVSDSEINSSSTGSTTTINQSQQSGNSSSNIKEKIDKTHSEIIENFIEYCNEGNVTKAYELLSATCKEVMFPTLEYFTNDYQKIVFSEAKIYTIEDSNDNTYKLRITPNILATGKDNNGIATEEYYTVVSENGEDKLNINRFVNRIPLTGKGSNNNIEIELVYVDQYIDYAIYTLNVFNNTSKTISLDSGESTRKMYLLGNNDKSMSARNELSSASLDFLPYHEKILQVKYYSFYSLAQELNTLVFEDVILDLDSYKNYTVKKDYTDRIRIEIQL